MFTNTRLKELLKSSKLITKQNFLRFEKEAEQKKIPLEKYILDQKILTEEALYQEIARILKMPFINLSDKMIRKDVLFLVPEPIAATHKIIAFDRTSQDELKLAVVDPDDLQTFEFISRKTDLKMLTFLATPSALEEALGQYRLSLKAEFQKITPPAEETKEEKKELEQLAEDIPVVRIVDSLLEHAIFEEASDIHIEPEENEVNVRYRVDGILRNVMGLPKSTMPGIVARIKVLSNLKLDEHRLPQDGRFKIVTPEHRFSIRVSVFPVFYGEKIVLRLLPESAEPLTLEQLGFLSKPLEVVKRNIKKPHGIILVTGPTGCGKTSTLYSILNILNKPEVNIITVEDPIEYRMKGVSQSQVNPKIGYTFATGLRSILRQDPNIIMVGEIRDLETADIAIHAALTGHLVFSTLHTNNAATALPRLVDMGVPAFLIAFTANMIMAQRLVRKICSGCAESYVLPKATLDELKKLFDLEAIETALKKEKILGPSQSIEKISFKRGSGCKRCGGSGYKGRTGIFEVLEITKPIAGLINKRGTAIEIEKMARGEGMTTLLEDGFIKAVQGITTIEEVMRVTKD